MKLAETFLALIRPTKRASIIACYLSIGWICGLGTSPSIANHPDDTLEIPYPASFSKSKTIRDLEQLRKDILAQQEDSEQKTRDLIAATVMYYNANEFANGLKNIEGILRRTSPESEYFLPMQTYQSIGYLGLNKHKRAYRILNSVLDNATDNLGLVVKTSGLIFQLCRKNVRRGQYREAHELAKILAEKEGLKRYADFASYYSAYTLGKAGMAEDDAATIESARAKYETAIGLLSASNRDLAGSVPAREAKRYLAYSYDGLGALLLHAGRWEEAIQAYKKALATQNLGGWRSARAYVNMGSAYAKLGDHEKAIDAFTQSTRFSEWQGDNLAISLSLWGQSLATLSPVGKSRLHQQALGLLDQSITTHGCSDETKAISLICKGEVFVKTGMGSESVAAYREALNLGKINPQTRARASISLADIYFKSALQYMDDDKTVATEQFRQSILLYSHGLEIEGITPHHMAHMNRYIGKAYQLIGDMKAEEKDKDEQYRLAEPYYSEALKNKEWTGSHRLMTLIDYAYILIALDFTGDALPFIREYLSKKTEKGTEREWALNLYVGCQAHQLESASPQSRNTYVKWANHLYRKFNPQAESKLEDAYQRIEAGETLGHWFLGIS